MNSTECHCSFFVKRNVSSGHTEVLRSQRTYAKICDDSKEKKKTWMKINENKVTGSNELNAQENRDSNDGSEKEKQGMKLLKGKPI